MVHPCFLNRTQTYKLQKVPGIRLYNLQKLLFEGNFITLTSFVVLQMRSEGNATKNG